MARIEAGTFPCFASRAGRVTKSGKPEPQLRHAPNMKPLLRSILTFSTVAALAAGCAQTTEQKIEKTTDAAITDTADAMNKVADEVKNVSTNVAAHVVDFSTNAWAKTKAGAHKTATVTTNVVNDVKQGFQ